MSEEPRPQVQPGAAGKQSRWRGLRQSRLVGNVGSTETEMETHSGAKSLRKRAGQKEREEKPNEREKEPGTKTQREAKSRWLGKRRKCFSRC